MSVSGRRRRRSDDLGAALLSKAAWEVLRGQLVLRCGGRCEASGAPLVDGRWAVHHRDSRGMGGTRRDGINALSNLLALSEVAHVWVHGHPGRARELGWICVSSDVPLETSVSTPVVLYSGRRVLLDPGWPGYLDAPGAPYDLGPHPFR